MCHNLDVVSTISGVYREEEVLVKALSLWDKTVDIQDGNGEWTVLMLLEFL